MTTIGMEYESEDTEPGCPECHGMVVRIKDTSPPPLSHDAAWKTLVCVLRRDRFWWWCPVTGWLVVDGLRLNMNRRRRQQAMPADQERRRR